jgi:transposase
VITIGVDPHKQSHTAEAIDGTETVCGQVRVVADRRQVERLVAWAAPFPDRQWGVEGANGVGLLLAQQLVAAGEHVVDVPATLAARVRVLASGRSDKTDEHDAAAVAVAALRHPKLRVVTVEDHTAVLGVLSERRAQLVAGRTQVLCRLHAVLRSLVPGGAKRFLSVTQAAAVLRGIRPITAIDRERKAIARELLTDVRDLDARIKTIDTRIALEVRATETSLTEIHGVGPVLAAKIIGIVGDINRFPTRARFAAYAGVSPVEASSGAHVRHRLNRRGNRQLNYAIHMIAVTQRAHPGPGRDYFERKLADGKSPAEARRCLKRHIANAVYRHLRNDAREQARGDNARRLQPA